jgi:FkbM family methyltransferase
MRTIFVDLGAFDGDSIDLALQSQWNFDVLYAFEPLKENFDKLRARHGTNPKVVLLNCAADLHAGETLLYKGNAEFGNTGGSLLQDMSSVSQAEPERVKTVDIVDFITTTFSPTDRVVLKLDIEGKEYEILQALLSTQALRRISYLYCEWHYWFLGMSSAEHYRFIRRLRKHGFDVSGLKELDEFAYVYNVSRIKLKLMRNSWYYLYVMRQMLKPILPAFALSLWRRRRKP